MRSQQAPAATHAVTVLPISYRYRYCDRCRREWPAERTHCPDCRLWLGEAPLERVEWLVAPIQERVSRATGYEHIAGSALCLRWVGPRPPDRHLLEVAALLAQLLPAQPQGVVAVRGQGWMVWTANGVRRAFLDALALRDRLVGILPSLEMVLVPGGRLRWGLWVDDFVLPCGGILGTPVVSQVAARTIFNFEPDGMLLVTEAIFQANRHWENFVCVPARRFDGSDCHGYRWVDRKRPSALDHARVIDLSPFVGRSVELAQLDEVWRLTRHSSQRVTIVAPAGAGKTRLVRQWLQRHPNARSLCANFSIFGGDLTSFAGQLAELPDDTFKTTSLVDTVLARIGREQARVLILDDLHWADPPVWDFLNALLHSLPDHGLLTLLSTRPTTASLERILAPAITLRLSPLPTADTGELAHRVAHCHAVAGAAARLADGNPLFVEQFAAWAVEACYSGQGWCPKTLHEVIMARIHHLESVRLRSLRQRASWSAVWMRPAVSADLDALEIEIGLWLDRLETGDYGDRLAVAFYLTRLRWVDFELFLIATLIGQPRPRSTRLGEAIDRLLLGSADDVLADMTRRVQALAGLGDPHLAEQAEAAGKCATEHYQWQIARRFYELACQAAPSRNNDKLRRRVAEIDQFLDDTNNDTLARGGGNILEELGRLPSVDPLRLPRVWLRLGQQFNCRRYLLRARQTADDIGATALRNHAQRALAMTASTR
jgi:hypothetical protein